VYAEEYGELKGKDSYNPFYEWRVVGDCKQCGHVTLEDHDGDDGCGCFIINDADYWWSEEEYGDKDIRDEV
jgi:hypothetical protein